MKKTVLILMLGVLSIASNLFAADGDLIIEGNVGIGSNVTTPGGRLEINTGTATTKGMIIKGVDTQSANFFELQDNLGSVLAQISSNGSFSNTVSNRGGFISNITFDNNDVTGGQGATYNVNITGHGEDLIYRGVVNNISYSGSNPTGTINRIDGTTSNFRFEGSGSITKNFASINLTSGSFYVSGEGRTYNVGSVAGIVAPSTNNITSGTLNVTNWAGISIPNHTSANLNIANLKGVSIVDQTKGTNNTNINIGTGSTGNWSIYNNSSYNNFFAGALGIGTTAPTEKLEVAGAIKIGNAAVSDCTLANEGTIKYVRPDFWGCNGSGWVKLNNIQ